MQKVAFRRNTSRTARTIAAAIVGSLLASAAWAQGFPARTVTVINYSAPGSAGEQMIRGIAQEASKSLGQAVVVEARPGGGGSIAFNAILTAPRGDGHLLAYLNAAPMIIRPIASGGPVPQPGKDYTPITFLYDAKQALVVNPSVPFRDVKGLIA